MNIVINSVCIHTVMYTNSISQITLAFLFSVRLLIHRDLLLASTYRYQDQDSTCHHDNK